MVREGTWMKQVVIAVDPGREKCGFAVVSTAGEVVYKAVLDIAALPAAVQRWAGDETVEVASWVLGDRTGAKAAASVLREAGVPERLIRTVDEHRSSEAGRRRYWREKPPRGWRRLIPTSMQAAPEPYDDFVAVELAHRYLAGASGEPKRVGP